MTAFATYHIGPVTIDGPPLAAGTEVEVRLIAVVADEASALGNEDLCLKVRDWTGPTAVAGEQRG